MPSELHVMEGMVHLAFYKIGLQSQLLGQNCSSRLLKLTADVVRLWRGHDLHALFLCEVGQHGIGLLSEARSLVTQAIQSAFLSKDVQIYVQNAYIAVLNEHFCSRSH